MNTEAVKKYLAAIGVPSAHLAAFEAEQLPEEFEMETAVSEFVKLRQELTLNNSEILKELKQKFNNEQYPAIIKPNLKAAKDAYGLSDEEMQSLVKDGDKYPKMKDVIAFGVAKLKKNGAASVDEVNKKLFDLQKTIDNNKETFEQEKSSIISGYETKIKNGKIETVFTNLVGKNEYILPIDTVKQVMLTKLKGKYNLDFNDKGEMVALNADGTKAADGKSFLNINDIIKNEAKEMKILKESNGGGTPPPSGGSGTTPPPPSGKKELSPRAKAMLERANKKE